jgi:hypothetical protein
MVGTDGDPHRSPRLGYLLFGLFGRNDGTAERAERDPLAQEMFDLHALLVWNAPVQGVRGQLAMARLTLMMLFALAGMAIFLVSVRSIRWAGVSDGHSCW